MYVVGYYHRKCTYNPESNKYIFVCFTYYNYILIRHMPLVDPNQRIDMVRTAFLSWFVLSRCVCCDFFGFLFMVVGGEGRGKNQTKQTNNKESNPTSQRSTLVTISYRQTSPNWLLCFVFLRPKSSTGTD